MGSGYAVASRKRNFEFHYIFKSIPDDDYLIEDYGCALQRDILVQGRLYVSEQHLCFKANIFGWVTTLAIPFSDVASIDKKMTALIIPNAIQVVTLHSRHTFASFLSRDSAYDLITSIWRISHPAVPPRSLSSSSSTTCSNASPPENSNNNVQHSSLVNPKKQAVVENHLVTSCKCSGSDEHFKDIVLDATYPIYPEKLYNILFQSDFLKNFWVESQNLTEIEISEWKTTSDAQLPLRNSSYIRPLNSSMGPKSTRCLMTDEHKFVDFEESISNLTVTRTPDVPSGSGFSVLSKTCISWAPHNSSRMIVSATVEWTKVNRFLKSIIDSSALSGQRAYFQDLDKALRQHIEKNQ
ncbi:GRAM domain-containing protein, partial [Phakopsora pachyrhizi]